MSLISSISGNSWNPTLQQASSSSRVRGGDRDGDGERQGGQGGPGGLLSAARGALEQLGIGSSSSASSSSAAASATKTALGSTTSDAQQALQNFMQTLMAALQSQHGQGSGAAQSGNTQAASGNDGDADDQASTIKGAGGAKRLHGGGRMSALKSDLDKLIQQLNSSSASGGSSSSTSTNAGSSTGSSALSNLQSSFQGLLSTVGGNTGTGASLTSFLQAFGQKLPDPSTKGALLNKSV